MTQHNESTSFLDALQRLELNLETPVVPGDLSGWIQRLRDSCDDAGRLLLQSVEDSHEVQLQQISKRDPEQLPRVQQLREEDQELVQDFETFAKQMSALAEAMESADQLANQPHTDSLIAEIVKAGLAFVIRARTQETALSTWHMEAFQRDRGLGD